MKALIKPAFLLIVVAACFFEFLLHRLNAVFRDIESDFHAFQVVLLIYFAVWCGIFLVLTFTPRDLLLVGLLSIAIAAFFKSYGIFNTVVYSVILLFGAMLGKAAKLLLNCENRSWDVTTIPKSDAGNFLLGLVLVLAFASWWHLDMPENPYHGPRWMGLWNNPNDYGMLMGVGVTLAIGLIAAERGLVPHSPKSLFRQKPPPVAIACNRAFLHLLPNAKWSANSLKLGILVAATAMMGTGLLFSYSRGAWAGTAIGLLYLTKARHKLRWRWIFFPGFIALAAIWLFWSLPDTAPWYLRRLDFSKGSVQHRLIAWKAGIRMIRDHPFGMGWNNLVDTYEKNYSPPNDGAAAITTNDYVMLGAQLGMPALICFVAYAMLCLRRPWSEVRSQESPAQSTDDQLLTKTKPEIHKSKALCEFMAPSYEFRIKTACRAGALVFLFTFWLDGGLFALATAPVFWILLELGSLQTKDVQNMERKKVDKAKSGSPIEVVSIAIC